MMLEILGKCPCGSDKTYRACCGVCHDDPSRALTAEQLMRSRYSAFALKNADYLLKTWHSSTRPRQLDLTVDHTEWRKLAIIATRQGQVGEDRGKVEFKAYYRHEHGLACLHEISRFRREQGLWFYVDGKLKPTLVLPLDSLPT